MQKGLGVTALVVAIIAIFIPFLGSWLTLPVALIALFAWGQGFGLGVGSIGINIAHLFFFSPLLWATAGAGLVGSEAGVSSSNATGLASGFSMLPWILILLQIGCLIGLVILNNKRSGSTTHVES